MSNAAKRLAKRHKEERGYISFDTVAELMADGDGLDFSDNLEDPDDLEAWDDLEDDQEPEGGRNIFDAWTDYKRSLNNGK